MAIPRRISYFHSKHFTRIVPPGQVRSLRIYAVPYLPGSESIPPSWSKNENPPFPEILISVGELRKLSQLWQGDKRFRISWYLSGGDAQVESFILTINRAIEKSGAGTKWQRTGVANSRHSRWVNNRFGQGGRQWRINHYKLIGVLRFVKKLWWSRIGLLRPLLVA